MICLKKDIYANYNSKSHQFITWNCNAINEGDTLISLINVGLRLFFLRIYSRPYTVIPDPTFVYFWKIIIENLGENRKKWLFSAISLFNLTKISGPPIVPDPSLIRFRYFFQTLRLFATLRLLRDIRVGGEFCFENLK